MKLVLETERTGYSIGQCGETLSVGELINLLQQYDEDTPIYFSNDNGYTYGALNYDTLKEVDEEEEE